jgi:hypothetical protein
MQLSLRMFKEVWSTPEIQKICEVVYTNNSKVDRNYIQQIYHQYFPNHISVAILLNIFHAKTRVIKEMNKYHPDFRATKQDLTTIFAIIQQYGSYPTSNELIEDFED